MNYLKIDNVGSLRYAGTQHDAIPEVCFDAGAEFNLNFFDTPAADDSNTQGGFSDAGSIEESTIDSICGSPPPSTGSLVSAELSETVGLAGQHQQADGNLHNQSAKHENGNNDRVKLMQPMSPNKFGKDYME